MPDTFRHSVGVATRPVVLVSILLWTASPAVPQEPVVQEADSGDHIEWISIANRNGLYRAFTSYYTSETSLNVQFVEPCLLRTVTEVTSTGGWIPNSVDTTLIPLRHLDPSVTATEKGMVRYRTTTGDSLIVMRGTRSSGRGPIPYERTGRSGLMQFHEQVVANQVAAGMAEAIDRCGGRRSTAEELAREDAIVAQALGNDSTGIALKKRCKNMLLSRLLLPEAAVFEPFESWIFYARDDVLMITTQVTAENRMGGRVAERMSCWFDRVGDSWVPQRVR